MNYHIPHDKTLDSIELQSGLDYRDKSREIPVWMRNFLSGYFGKVRAMGLPKDDNHE